jgi:hypothetical protein
MLKLLSFSVVLCSNARISELFVLLEESVLNSGCGIIKLKLNLYSGGWSPIGSTRHCGHQWSIVQAPGWLWWWRNWWNDWQGKPKYSEKTCLNAALSTTNPTCCPDANQGRRGGKPATNRLSYATAWLRDKLRSIYFILTFVKSCPLVHYIYEYLFVYFKYLTTLPVNYII